MKRVILLFICLLSMLAYLLDIADVIKLNYIQNRILSITFVVLVILMMFYKKSNKI